MKTWSFRGSDRFKVAPDFAYIFFLRSSCVLLLDQVTFDILLKVDNVASLDTNSDSGVCKQHMNGAVSFLKSCSLTSLGGVKCEDLVL